MTYTPSKDPQRTVLVICMGMLVLHFFVGWQWPLPVALTIGVIGALSQRMAVLIDRLWMRLGWVLGLVMPKVVLGAVFYLMLTPIALLSRLLGKKDPLMMRPQTGSMFITANRTFDRDYFEKTW
jgi:hypothetical protein